MTVWVHGVRGSPVRVLCRSAGEVLLRRGAHPETRGEEIKKKRFLLLSLSRATEKAKFVSFREILLR